MDSKMIAILYLISLGVFFLFLVIATIAVIASSIKKKRKAKKARKKNQEDYYADNEGEDENYQEPEMVAYTSSNDSSVEDDIFEEAILEATQIANETAAQVSAPAQPVQQEAVSPVQPMAPAQPMQQEAVAPVQPVVPEQPVQQEAVAPVQPVVPEQPVQQEAIIPTQPMVVDSAFAEDSAFVDSAFAEDSAFADSAFAGDSAFVDSAFVNNNYDGNAFPGSAFENPTPVDPSAMMAATMSYQQGNMGQAPVGNFYWFNKEDVEDRPDYKPMEMFYRYFKVADECIEDLLVEMYDCALVRTEDIRFIAYGIEPRHVAMRDVAATGNAAYNAAKKRKEPTKEDLDKIYRKWCSYVDKLFEIVEFRADNTTIGIIRDKLYEFGKSDVDVLIEGK